MRVSSLSDERVIRLLTQYFVPVWVSRDHYQLGPPSQAEQEELLRLDRDRRRRGLKGGTVSVFLIAPDGTVAASQPVQLAYQPEHLLPFLKKYIETEGFRPRDPAAVRASAAPRPRLPARTAGGLLLTVRTRFDDQGPNRGVGRDRVELAPAEWAALLPAGDARPGSSWPVPRKVTDRFFRLFYPPLPHWDAQDSKVVSGSLTATAVAVSARAVRVKLAGTVELAYPYTGQATDGRVKARLVGALRYDPARRTISSLVLVSDEAGYVWYWENKPQPRAMRIAVETEPAAP
jgi:hypothetical protein